MGPQSAALNDVGPFAVVVRGPVARSVRPPVSAEEMAARREACNSDGLLYVVVRHGHDEHGRPVWVPVLPGSGSLEEVFQIAAEERDKAADRKGAEDESNG